MSDEIIYPLSNGRTVAVWEWMSISSHSFWVYDHLTMLGLELIQVINGALENYLFPVANAAHICIRHCYAETFPVDDTKQVVPRSIG